MPDLTPQPESPTPAPRLGLRQARAQAADESRQRATEIEQFLALRRREGETRQQREKEDAAAIERVRDARQTIESALLGLQRTASELRDRARRNPDEVSANHLIYANAHLRLTGALANGIRRTASMERVLNSAEAKREDARRREEEDRLRRELRAHERHINSLTLPTSDVDDFDEVYGDLTDA